MPFSMIDGVMPGLSEISETPAANKLPTLEHILSATQGQGGFPDIHKAIRSWLQQKVHLVTGQMVDPDTVYVHHFPAVQSRASSRTFTGWEHTGEPDQSMTLTKALQEDFFSAERYGYVGKAKAVAHFVSSNDSVLSLGDSSSVSDFFSRLGELVWDRTLPGYIYSKIKDDVPEVVESWRDLDSAYGLYLDGPDKQLYNEDNELRMKPSQFLSIVRVVDIQPHVIKGLDEFWSAHGTHWRGLARKTFIDEVRFAHGQELLEQQDVELLMKAGAPHLRFDSPASAEELEAIVVPDPAVKVLRFDINGYAATDIFRFVRKDGAEWLYVPGVRPVFHFFKHLKDCYDWVVEQGRDQARLMTLASHFSLKHRQQGIFGPLSANGVDSTLKKLGNGEMEPSSKHINFAQEEISQDLFSCLAQQVHARVNSDADVHIKSNGEVHTDDALRMLQAANAIFSIPLAMLGPIGMTINAGLLGTQVGVEVERSVNGDTQEERKADLLGAIQDAAMLSVVHSVGLGRVHGEEEISRTPGRQVPEAPGANGEPTSAGLNPHWDPSMEQYLTPRSPEETEAGTPGPAKRPRYEDPDNSSQGESRPPNDDDSVGSSSDADTDTDIGTSGDEYEAHDDAEHEIDLLRTNPFQAEISLPQGARFNSRGMIERTDFARLYRVEKASRVERRGDPQVFGFRASNFFGGPVKMLDNDVVIVSRTKEGAVYYGETEFKGDYDLYEIDGTDLPAVSLNENIELNERFTEMRQDLSPGTINELRENGRLNEFAESAVKFDEVHLSRAGLSPRRIHLIPH